jgi:hypothetical protein
MNSLGETYLLERGIDLDFAGCHGLEIDKKPLNSERIKQRLGGEIKVGDLPLSHVADEIIWIPLRNSQGLNGEYIARPLPNLGGHKFLCACDRGAPIYIPPLVYKDSSQTDKLLVITEGPIKALAIVQAGFHAIGLNGVWCAADKDQETGRLTLRQELKAFDLRGRKLYTAFDADLSTKAEVRQALIRLFILLTIAGAEVFQLTSWDKSDGKGIDDFLVHERPTEPGQTLQALISDAAPFIETLNKNVLDVDLVAKELARIEMSPPIRSHLARELGRRVGVGAKELRYLGKKEANQDAPPQSHSFNVAYEPWAEEVNALALFNLVMAQIAKEALLDEHQLFVCALWIFFTWVHEHIHFSPIL